MTLCTPADVPRATATMAPPAPFDAVLYPNRSLDQFGFHLLMAAIVLVSAGIGAAFVIAGAWPVTGFLGLDVVLLYLAFPLELSAGSARRVHPAGRPGARGAPGGAERASARVAFRRPLAARHDRRSDSTS